MYRRTVGRCRGRRTRTARPRRLALHIRAATGRERDHSSTDDAGERRTVQSSPLCHRSPQLPPEHYDDRGTALVGSRSSRAVVAGLRSGRPAADGAGRTPNGETLGRPRGLDADHDVQWEVDLD